MKDIKLKKCKECFSLIEVLEECNCDNCELSCCGSKMLDVIANESDASKEKHIPSFVREGENIIITVNHVMEDDHYIKWIKVKGNDYELTKYFNPGDEINLSVPYSDDLVLYSYCNKHGVWEKEVA